MERKIIIKDDDYGIKEYWADCTDMMQEIMGENVVKHAEVRIFDYTICPIDVYYAQSVISDFEEEFKNNGKLKFDSSEISVELHNGKKFLISNSEWGSIQKL